MDNENRYNIQDLDEYIRQGEPERREKAIAWQTAIGLQAVDGLTVSDYLIELAIKNIKDELTSQEVDRLINEHYAAKHKVQHLHKSKSCCRPDSSKKRKTNLN